MCLDIQHDARERIATKDITCYKVIQDSFSFKDKYRTFYMDKSIKIGVMYRSAITIQSGIFGSSREVHKGLHSFKTKTDLFEKFSKKVGYRFMHVVKCTIPKGAKYYVGTFSGCRGYASNRLRYDEIVYTWK